MWSRIGPVFRSRLVPLGNKVFSPLPLIPRFTFPIPLFPQRVSTPFSSLPISCRSFTMPFSSSFTPVRPITFAKPYFFTEAKTSLVYTPRRRIVSSSHDRVKTALQTYYQTKKSLPGLLTNHAQPIADINLSIIEYQPQVKRSKMKDKEQEENEEDEFEIVPFHESVRKSFEELHDINNWVDKNKTLVHYEELHDIRHPIDVTDIFDNSPDVSGQLEAKPIKRLLIVGHPGVGKTTMSQHMAYQWATQKLWTTKFDYLFWIPLRNLLRDQRISKEALTLATLIQRECFGRRKIISTSEIESILSDKSNGTLVLLDGYDEVAHLLEEPSHPFTDVLQHALNAENLILTSRPYQLHHLDLSSFDRRLENTGFTDTDIIDYVERYFVHTAPSQPEQAKAVLAFLKAHPHVWGTAHIPINLALICEFWQSHLSEDLLEDKTEKPVSSALDSELNMTRLYQELTRHLLKRYLEKKGVQTRNRSFAWLEKQCQVELEFLGRLAFNGLQADQIHLTKELQHRVLNQIVTRDTKKDIDNSSSFQTVLQSGFLRSTGGNLKQEEIDKSHYFIHLTFQEFLAAIYQVKCLEQPLSTPEHRMAKLFLMNEKYNSRYHVMFGFMAGLLSSDKSIAVTPAFLAFWEIVSGAPRDLTGVVHTRLLIRCLEETDSDRRIPQIETLLTQVGQWGKTWNTNHAIFNLLFSSFQQAPRLLKQAGILQICIVSLENKEPDFSRRNAADALGRLKTVTPEVITALVTAVLKDKDSRVRRYALEALGNLQVATPDVIKALITAVGDSDEFIKRKAIEILGKLKAATSEIIVALIIALEDKEEYVRQHAAEALGNLKVLTPRIITALTVALKDKKEGVRHSAVTALANLKAVTPEIIAILVASLRNEDEEVRRNGAEALKILKVVTPEFIIALIATLEDKEKNIRCNGIETLGNLKTVTPEVIAALTIALGDKEENVRQIAIKALWKLKAVTPEIITALTIALGDKEENVRQIAIGAIGELKIVTPEVIRILVGITLSKNDNFFVRYCAIKTLGELKVIASEVIRALITALKDEFGFVRECAANVLGDLRTTTPEVITALITTVLRDRDKSVKCNAVRALGYLQTTTPEVIAAFVTTLLDKDEDVRYAAVSAVGCLQIPTPEIISALITIARQENKNKVGHEAIRVLGKLDITPCLLSLEPDSLEVLLKDKFLVEERDIILLATPLVALLQAYFATQNSYWLPLIAHCAFHRAVAITFMPTDKTIVVYERRKSTALTLTEGRRTELMTKLIEAFEKLAFKHALPNDIYKTVLIDLRKISVVESALGFATEQKATVSPMKMVTVGRSLIPAEQLDYLFYLQGKVFLNCLKEKIVSYVKQLNPKNPKPKCFVSYAWGEPYYEYKVEQLVNHLEQAGFEMLFDRWEDRRGKELMEFVEKLTKADFILVIGTEFYLKKYERRVENYDDREHVVRLEARLINHLVGYSTKHSDKVITLLFESTPEKCFPPLLHPKLACDFIRHDYFNELLKLIHDLHGIPNRDSTFQTFVDDFKQETSALVAHISPEQKEIYRKEKVNVLLKKEAEYDAKAQHRLKEKMPHVTHISMLSTSGFDSFSQPPFPKSTSTSSKKISLISFLASFILLIAYYQKKQKEALQLPSPPKEVFRGKLPPNNAHFFVGREDLLKILGERFKPASAEGACPPLTLSTIIGLGGIGKTQLATYYAHHPEQPYALRVWFAADSATNLLASYRAWAQDMKLIAPEDKIMSAELIGLVKKYFDTHPNWLIVYDNAGPYAELKEYIPTQGGHLVVTTRRQEWQDVGIPGARLNIQVFTPVEATSYLKKITTQTGVEEEEAMIELASALGHLPLALAQAGAYIKKCGITTADYLARYKRRKLELLAEKLLPADNRSEPVATTWHISLKAIEDDERRKNEPLLSLQVLKAMAYLHADHIPRPLLERWLFESKLVDSTIVEDILDKVIGHLKDYSLISTDPKDKTVSLHCLLQDVVREYESGQPISLSSISKPQETKESLSHAKLIETVDFLITLAKSLVTEFEQETDVFKDEIRKKLLFPHILTLLNHFGRLPNIAPPLSLINLLFQPPNNTYYFIKGEYQGALLKKLSEQFELFSIGSTNSPSLMIVMTGSAGMEKTELASYYARHFKHLYPLRVWFRADSATNLLASYRECAHYLKLIDPEDTTPAPELIRIVKQYLETHPGWLVIYDDAAAYAELKDYIPAHGGHLLVTTREQGWQGIGIQINVNKGLTSSEAVAFFTAPSSVSSSDVSSEALGFQAAYLLHRLKK